MSHGPTSAADYLPKRRTLVALRKAARSCKGCDLFKSATQTVFGEGAEHALVVFVGEQPGDMEDRKGRPFVGPAGRILDKALGEVGIRRDDVYVTNAVKHFKWIQRGKRRMHQKPLIRQVIACKPWLKAELEAIRPGLIVCLGATAAQSILGTVVRISKERGRLLPSPSGDRVCVTIHPSAIYRQPERSQQKREYRDFLADIKFVKAHLTP